MNLDNGNIHQLSNDELPGPREVKLSPDEAAALSELPADDRPAEFKAMQIRQALKLTKKVRDFTGAQLRVFRVNDHDWVAALIRDVAISWYEKNSTRPVEPPVKQVDLWTNVDTPYGERPLWFLLADRFREVIAEGPNDETLRGKLLAPFLVASTVVGFDASAQSEGGAPSPA